MFPTFYGQAKSVLGDDYEELPAPGYNGHFIIIALRNPHSATSRR